MTGAFTGVAGLRHIAVTLAGAGIDPSRLEWRADVYPPFNVELDTRADFDAFEALLSGVLSDAPATTDYGGTVATVGKCGGLAVRVAAPSHDVDSGGPS